MFFLMVIFFNYPANFAMESSRLGTVSKAAIPVIMALGDVFGFLGGLAYPKLKTGLGRNTKVVAPLMFWWDICCFSSGARCREHCWDPS